MTVTENTPFTGEDDTFHLASDDPYWTETTWWSLNIPERRMGAWLHAGYRTNTGAVTWRVFLWDPTGADPGRLAYYKLAPDVPMPAKTDLRNLEFPGGGFRVKMLTPLMDYHVAYRDADADFALEFEHRSVHPPHRFTPGEAPAMHNPHLDQLGHVTGLLTLRGNGSPSTASPSGIAPGDLAEGTTPRARSPSTSAATTGWRRPGARGGAKSSASAGAAGSSTSSVTPTPRPGSSVSCGRRTATPPVGRP